MTVEYNMAQIQLIDYTIDYTLNFMQADFKSKSKTNQ